MVPWMRIRESKEEEMNDDSASLLNGKLLSSGDEDCLDTGRYAANNPKVLFTDRTSMTARPIKDLGPFLGHGHRWARIDCSVGKSPIN